MTCYFCNRKERMAKDWYSRKRNQDSASRKRNESTGNSSKLFNLMNRMTKRNETGTITSVDIVVDSGASAHVVSDWSYRTDIQEVPPITVELASRTSITATLKGRIELNTVIRQGIITNAHYIPTIKMSKLSCSRLDERGVTTKTERRICTLLDKSDSKILQGLGVSKPMVYWLQSW